jgi:intracellular sulfur oxidation DsrE/DsrF family protein
MRGLKFIFLSAFLLSGLAYAEEKKAVFDLTTGDSERIEGRIIQSIKGLSEYYKERQVEFKAVVVISGKAYKYFIQDLENSPYKDDEALAQAQEKFQPMLEELHQKYGVRFDMCGAGMKMRNISADSLYPFVHSDKTKYVYLIDWQNEGYAYIPI